MPIDHYLSLVRVNSDVLNRKVLRILLRIYEREFLVYRRLIMKFQSETFELAFNSMTQVLVCHRQHTFIDEAQ